MKTELSKRYERELETTFDYTIGNEGGSFFDVNVLQDLTIKNFDVHPYTTGTGRVEVWYRSGSYTGKLGSTTPRLHFVAGPLTASPTRHYPRVFPRSGPSRHYPRVRRNMLANCSNTRVS